MFSLLGTRLNKKHCDGMSRRDFVKVGTLGVGGLGLSDLLRFRAHGNDSSLPKDTSVVLLWLDGGPTQIETWDPKMDVPEDFRSLVGAVQTRVPGMAFGGVFPKLAQLADKMAVVRSFATGADQSHPGGCHAMKTGYPFPAGVTPAFETQLRPSMGSAVSRVRGANHPRTGVPTYVETDYGVSRKFGFAHSGGLWLGREHAPFRATHKDALDDMVPQFSPGVLQNRRDLLAAFDRIDRSVDQGLLDSLDAYRQQALQVLAAGQVKQAFDLTRKSAMVRGKYGRGLGEHMLLARRLCEAGAGFVTVYYGDWDMHSNFGSMTRSLESQCPVVDHAVAAFIEDIQQRGLNEKILLVVTGEMGRTPRISGLGGSSFGREHWPNLCSLMFAGGGLNMGQVIGESTAKAELPKSQPYYPQDLMATLYQHLGIALDLQFHDLAGRPVSMIENGRPIAELF